MEKSKEYQPNMDYINEEKEFENSITKRKRKKKAKIETMETVSDDLSRESTPKKVYDDYKRRMMFHIQKHQSTIKPKTQKSIVRPKFASNYSIVNMHSQREHT